MRRPIDPAVMTRDPKELIIAAVQERIRTLEEELDHWNALLRTLNGNPSACGEEPVERSA